MGPPSHWLKSPSPERSCMSLPSHGRDSSCSLAWCATAPQGFGKRVGCCAPTICRSQVRRDHSVPGLDSYSWEEGVGKGRGERQALPAGLPLRSLPVRRDQAVISCLFRPQAHAGPLYARLRSAWRRPYVLLPPATDAISSSAGSSAPRRGCREPSGRSRPGVWRGFAWRPPLRSRWRLFPHLIPQPTAEAKVAR